MRKKRPQGRRGCGNKRKRIRRRKKTIRKEGKKLYEVKRKRRRRKMNKVCDDKTRVAMQGGRRRWSRRMRRLKAIEERERRER